MNNVFAGAMIAAGMLVAPAAWATDWDESINGDLSGDRLNPTVLNLTTGNNTITATSSAPDLEYYRVNLPPGTRLTSITLTQFTTATTFSFIGVQSGPTFTEPPVGTNAANLLGWTHFGTTLLNTDILDNMGQAVPAIGFTPPLGNGTYTFWSQETSANPTTYRLVFAVSAPAVPGFGPAYAALLVIGLAWFGVRGLRRRAV